MASQGRQYRRARHDSRSTLTSQGAAPASLETLEPRTLLSAVPVAMDDVATTEPETAVVIDVLANDIDDAPFEPWALTILSNTINGSVMLDFSTGLVTYTPNAGFTGVDTFGYVVSDLDGNISNEATVTVTVALPSDPQPPPPVLEDLTFTAPSGIFNRYLALSRNGDMLEITNRLTNQVLFSHAMDLMNSLTIEAASAKDSMHLMIDMSGGDITLPGGLHLVGGNSRLRDMLVIRTMGTTDTVDLSGSTAMVNGLTIEMSNFEKVKFRTSHGIERHRLADPPGKKHGDAMKACRPMMSFKLKHLKHAHRHC